MGHMSPIFYRPLFCQLDLKAEPILSTLVPTTKKQSKDNIYFNNIAVDHNRLGELMQTIGKLLGISTLYTNDSCRATSLNVLDTAQIRSRRIMCVTAHTADSSLKSCLGRTNGETQIISE